MLSISAAFLLYAGTVSAVGGIAFALLVLPRAGLVAAERRTLVRRAATLVRVGALATLVGAGLDLAHQLLAFRDPFVPLRDDLELLVGGTLWGRVWSVRIAAALLLLLSSLPITGSAGAGSGGIRRLRWAVATVAGATLAVTPALSGHAIGSEALTGFAVAADAAHVLAASVWIGGIAGLLVAAGRPGAASGAADDPPETGAGSLRSDRLASLVDTFSPVALVCGGIVIATGVFQSWLHLGGIEGLDTSYGRALLAKVALATGVFAAGAINWRRVRPLLRSGSARGLLRRSGSVEFFLAQAVLLATAVLTNLSPPS